MATDISRTALEKARKAEYGDWSMRRAGASLVDNRHFTRRGPSFRLAGRFRKRVSFRMLNLETDDFPSSENGTAHLDLILCRNVLMYFGTTSVRQVARKLFACLADGGWLVVGPSDPPLWEYAPFKTEITPSGVLYRRRTACAVDHEDQEAVSAPCRQSAGVFPATRKQETAPSDRRREGADAEITWEIRTLAANGYSAAAAVAASLALKVYPLSPDLYCLQGAAFIAEGMKDKAAAALRRAIYLDRALPEAHFLLATVLQERDLAAAVRAFSNAAALLAGRPPSEAAQLCLGETAGSLERHARERIAALGRIRRSS